MTPARRRGSHAFAPAGSLPGRSRVVETFGLWFAVASCILAPAASGARPPAPMAGGGDAPAAPGADHDANRDATWLVRDVLHRVEGHRVADARWSGRGYTGREEPGPSAGTVRAAAGYDVLHYEIAATPDLAAGRIDGTTRVTIESTTAGLASVLLHLTALEVSRITIGPTLLPFSHVGDELVVTLDHPYAVGESFVMEITYGGVPLHESFGGFWLYPDMAFSMGVGIYTLPPSMGRYWFPCFDEPDDKATVRGLYTAPAGMRAVGNGLLAGTTPAPGGATTWIWEDTHPMSTYLMAMAVADWRTVDDPVDLRIHHHVLPADSVNAVTSFQNVGTMMAAFESTYGPYVWGDRFSFVGVRKGDMEHATCVAHLRNLINGNNFYDPILAHELSHHWWGDWVTIADWPDVWLSEGFATYSEAAYAEYIGGASAYHTSMNGIMDYYLSSGETYPIYDPEFLWGSTSYEKGGSVLHMLRRVVGDADFGAILSAWGAAHGFGNAVTTDFIDVVESVTGEDLGWFFQEWVYSPGYPDYRWQWLPVAAGGSFAAAIHVDQVQGVGPIFDMPVEIRVTTSSGTHPFTVVIDQGSQDFSLPVPETPLDVAFDPDRWVLCRKTEVQVGVPAASPPPTLLVGPASPNPFSPATSVRVVVVDATAEVRATIFDAAGRAVRRVLAAPVPERERILEWDGTDDAGRAMPGGLYFLRIDQGRISRTVRLVLLR